MEACQPQKKIQGLLKSLPLKKKRWCNLSFHFRVYTEKKFLFKRNDISRCSSRNGQSFHKIYVPKDLDCIQMHCLLNRPVSLWIFKSSEAFFCYGDIFIVNCEKQWCVSCRYFHQRDIAACKFRSKVFVDFNYSSSYWRDKNITYIRNNKDYSHFRFRELNKPKETGVSGSILNNISAFPVKLYNRSRNTTAILLADNYTPSKEPTIFCTLHCVIDVELQASRPSIWKCYVSFLQLFLGYLKTVAFQNVCFLSWTCIDVSGFFGDSKKKKKTINLSSRAHATA